MWGGNTVTPAPFDFAAIAATLRNAGISSPLEQGEYEGVGRKCGMGNAEWVMRNVDGQGNPAFPRSVHHERGTKSVPTAAGQRREGERV